MESVTVGTGEYMYDAIVDWEQLPDGIDLKETPGVAVASNDNVVLLTRNTEHPVMVLDRHGRLLRTFGAGAFSGRTHGLFAGPDDTIWCSDDGRHLVTHWTLDGTLLHTIGVADQPQPRWSGKPFNRPTHAAVSPKTGFVYISDGYGNARVHKYTPDGEYVLSWGEPGIDPGQFIRPHNVAIDADDNVYIADRECHRVQVFDADGRFLHMWNNIHRPDGMVIGPDGNVYIGELNGQDALLDGCPGLGHRVSILSPDGKLLARLGAPDEGDGPGEFIAPHGVAVDSRGDIYVGEVAYSIRGRHMDPPRYPRSLKKLVRKTPLG